MWSVVVEVGLPRSDQLAGMAQTVEQMLIEAFVAHASIEALDEAVLHWLAGGNVVPVDLTVFLPF